MHIILPWPFSIPSRILLWKVVGAFFLPFRFFICIWCTWLKPNCLQPIAHLDVINHSRNFVFMVLTFWSQFFSVFVGLSYPWLMPRTALLYGNVMYSAEPVRWCARGMSSRDHPFCTRDSPNHLATNNGH